MSTGSSVSRPPAHISFSCGTVRIFYRAITPTALWGLHEVLKRANKIWIVWVRPFGKELSVQKLSKNFFKMGKKVKNKKRTVKKWNKNVKLHIKENHQTDHRLLSRNLADRDSGMIYTRSWKKKTPDKKILYQWNFLIKKKKKEGKWCGTYTFVHFFSICSSPSLSMASLTQGNLSSKRCYYSTMRN